MSQITIRRKNHECLQLILRQCSFIGHKTAAVLSRNHLKIHFIKLEPKTLVEKERDLQRFVTFNYYF